MAKTSVGYVFMLEPNGNQILLIGVGKEFYKIDEDGCTKLEIIKSGDVSFKELVTVDG